GAASRRTASSSRSSSSCRTPGLLAVNSTPSCSRVRRGRIHSSPASSPPPRRPTAAARAEPESVRSSKPRTDAAMVRFPTDALFLIAGPCVLETDALNLRVGEHLARLAARVPGGIIYKASFDKANRSNAGAHRGPGLDEGLAALARVRDATGLPILTDVHLPEQCGPAASVVD